jgi:DNA polymerase-3 subunit delta'
MPFSEIFGQAQALGQLNQALQAGRLAHAYLFEGPEGVGKSLAARALARMLLCRWKGACSMCETCRLILEDAHPWVRFYRLSRGSRNIGVDVVRDDLIPFLSLRSAPGEYKIAVVDPADALSEDAANMLLKTLEEPGRWSLVVLVAASAQALIPTVRSRCQLVRFARIPEHLIAEQVMRRTGAGSGHARVVARLSGGSMGRALELAGSDFAAWRERVIDQFAEVLAGKADPMEGAGKLLAIAAEGSKGLQERRVGLQHALDLLLTYLRDLLVAREGTHLHLLNEDRPGVGRESAVLSEEELLDVFDRVFQAKSDIDANVNPQIAFEEFCMDASRAAEGKAAND